VLLRLYNYQSSQRGNRVECVTRTRTSDNPKHWYDRAAEMRLLAYDMKNEGAQRLMFKLADEYDRLGDRAAERQVKHAKQSAPTSVGLARP